MRDIEELKSYGKQCEEELQSKDMKVKELESELAKVKTQMGGSMRSVTSDRVVESRELSASTVRDSRSQMSSDKLITKINKLEYT